MKYLRVKAEVLSMRGSVRTVLVIVCLVIPTAVATSSTGNAAGGAVVDEGWVPTYPSGYGLQGVRLRDELEYNEAISVLRAKPDPSKGAWKTCTAITAVPCSSVPKVEFSAILQPCTSSSQLDCVAEFGTVDATGKRVPAEYSGVFPSVGLNDYPAEPSVGLPVGGPGTLWTVAESAGVPVRTHLVRAVVSGTAVPGQKVQFTNFAANISPETIRKFPCPKVGAETEIATACRIGDRTDTTGEFHNGDASGWAGYNYGFGANDGFDCLLSGNLDVAAAQADCAERKAFKKDVTYYLTVRLSQAVSGWMHGRLADPSITLEDVSGVTGAVTLSVAARPVSVPAIVVDKYFADLPAAMQEKYRATGGWPATGGGYHGASGVGAGGLLDPTDPRRNRRSNPSPYGADSIAELEAWLPVVNDTAIADPSSWTFRTLGSGELGAAERCATAKNVVTGIVTTNATVYKAGAPVFDSASGTLNYTVSAPHYMSSGDVFKGAYSLIIRSEVARCIYGFTSAPITASIEVTDTGAEQSTVATSVSEKDGWMKLTAAGFTHSTPTIRAAFSQSTGKAGAGTSTPSTSGATGGSVLAVGRSVTRAALLKQAAMTSTSRSKVSVAIASTSKKVCRIAGTSVRMIGKGKCSVTVTVVTGAKKTRKTVKLTVA